MPLNSNSQPKVRVEGSGEFVPVMMGSGVFRGAFTLEHAYAATDVDGTIASYQLVSGPGAGNGSLEGEEYVIDKTAPVLTLTGATTLTLEAGSSAAHAEAFLAALDHFPDSRVVITLPNADTDSAALRTRRQTVTEV